MKNVRSKRGFSLVELTIAMACYAVLASAVVPIFISHFNNKAAQKTAYEILSIAEASKNYYIDNSSWPTSLEELKSSSYLDQNWMAENPWGNPYLISDNTMFLSISSQVPLSLVPNVKAILPVSTNNIDVVICSIAVPDQLMSTLSDIPSGVIAIWSGLIADIPDGWELADGTCSIACPDLRDKFIIGASSDQLGEAVTGVDGSFTKEGGRAYIDFSHTHPFGSSSDFISDHGVACVSGDCMLIPSSDHTHKTEPYLPTAIVPKFYSKAFIIKD